ncbi:MAG: cytochrome c [Deltaproteobacteria bacterium]
MTTNQLFVRDFTLVSSFIAAVLVVGIWLAPAARPDPPRQDVAPVASGAPPGAALGARLYQAKGCIACHTVDGTPKVGPSFLHDFGSTVTLTTGTTVAMDATYIRESLLSPAAKARPGYPSGVMPSFDGVLAEREIQAIEAYLESLR